MLDVALHQTPRIFQRKGCFRPDALPFERFVPTFDFSVRLRLKRRSPARDHANRRDVSRAVGERSFGERGGTPALRLGVQRAVIQPSAAVPQIRKALLANRRFDCVGVQPAPVAHHAQALLAVEALPLTANTPISIPGYGTGEVMYHVGLLYDHGFVKGLKIPLRGHTVYHPDGLTASGHECLDSIRDEGVWEKAKAISLQRTGSVTFESIRLALADLWLSLGEEKVL